MLFADAPPLLFSRLPIACAATRHMPMPCHAAAAFADMLRCRYAAMMRYAARIDAPYASFDCCYERVAAYAMLRRFRLICYATILRHIDAP